MQVPVNQAKFRDLFERPSLERFLTELGDIEFEHFIAYVFRQAGFRAESIGSKHVAGIDVALYDDASPTAPYFGGVQVKHFQTGNHVNAPDVNKLRGGISKSGGKLGYFVTTSEFNPFALREFDGSPPLWPIDGHHLLRYITYLNGSPVHGAQTSSNGQGTQRQLFPPIRPEALLTADKIIRRSPSKTKVLMIANHKGGVGKTTTALNLGFGLAAKGKQVLLVDMDAQANLTRALAYPKATGATPMHLGEYFNGQRALPQLVNPTNFDHVWLIPSHHDLTRSDPGLASGPEAEVRFAMDLHAVDVIPPPVLNAQPFDWIIIDTGPSVGFFNRSALAAAHYLIVPLAPGAFADMGVNLLRKMIETMGALTGVPIKVLGCLVTMWKDDATHKDLLQPVRNQLDAQGISIFNHKIPLDLNNIEKAFLESGRGEKKMLFSHKTAKSAQAYTDVIQELLGKVEDDGVVAPGQVV